MAEFKKAPDAGSSRPLLSGDDQAPSLLDIAGLALAAYWPVLFGIVLFAAFRVAGKRLYGSICIGVMALLQLWMAGVFSPG